MNPRPLVDLIQLAFLGYFVVLSAVYLLLNLMSLLGIANYMHREEIDKLPLADLGMDPPVTLIVPAFNESATILTAVRSLLQQDYAEYEVVVVNDGSTDDTLERLIEAFHLLPFPEAYRMRLRTSDIRQIYQSPKHPNVRVIDKENGGKADALNAGINAARYPLYCAVDADSILQRDSLRRVVQPFLEDPATVASGGSIRIANGCRVEGGFLLDSDLPRNPLALFQIVEYLRAFLFGRLGWSPLNALLVISGAFGVFRKEKVIAAGGYKVGAIGEDMELVVRLHRHLRLSGERYRIVFVPDPICWTDAPASLAVLGTQRVRWQHGLGESLLGNRELLFHRKGGLVGWLAFPFMLAFELFGPAIEIFGYLVMVGCYLAGLTSKEALVAFFLVATGMGVILSLTALLLEELSFHLYPKPRQLAWLVIGILLENLGYRQLVTLWRARGLFRYLTGEKAVWGRMQRSGEWGRATTVSKGT